MSPPFNLHILFHFYYKMSKITGLLSIFCPQRNSETFEKIISLSTMMTNYPECMDEKVARVCFLRLLSAWCGNVKANHMEAENLLR